MLAIKTAGYGQVKPARDWKPVLLHSKVGKTYIFDRSKKDDYDRTELTYLGKLKASDGRTFKIIISRWYWGFSPRATSRIRVFNAQNRYLGNYYMTMTTDLPSRIEDNALVFINKYRDGCDPALVIRINFLKGVPKEFFVECKDKLGDIYRFDPE